MLTTRCRGMLHDEDKYPDPHTFKPERWLGGNQDPNVYSLDIAFGFGRRYELCDLAYICAQA